MFEFWFYGNDGEFSYRLGTYTYPESAFRHALARLGKQVEWCFDGDGWYTELTYRFESGHMGGYLITRQS